VKFSINTPTLRLDPRSKPVLDLRILPHGQTRGASLIVWGLLQLLKAARAIHARGRRKVWLRRDQQGDCAVACVKMLEDDAVGPDWKLEQIPLFPIVALLVDKRLSGALDHNENHAALAALLAAAARRRNLLRIEHDELMRRGIYVGMHVPLHHALRIDFPIGKMKNGVSNLIRNIFHPVR